MSTNLDAIRACHAHAATLPLLVKVDADLANEAGMDGNLARMLQAARDLDEGAHSASWGAAYDAAYAVTSKANETMREVYAVYATDGADEGAALDCARSLLDSVGTLLALIGAARGAR